MKRGTVTKNESELIAVWIPRPMLAAVDKAVKIEDSDRSKFVRRAVKNRIEELGGIIEDAPAEAGIKEGK
jgi:metal-responsive CopG/Arc/MetJ family transcriptional regulator